MTIVRHNYFLSVVICGGFLLAAVAEFGQVDHAGQGTGRLAHA